MCFYRTFSTQHSNKRFRDHAWHWTSWNLHREGGTEGLHPEQGSQTNPMGWFDETWEGAGNEAADKLATEGASMAPLGTGHFGPIPQVYVGNLIEIFYLASWDKQWADWPECRQTGTQRSQNNRPNSSRTQPKFVGINKSQKSLSFLYFWG